MATKNINQQTPRKISEKRIDGGHTSGREKKRSGQRRRREESKRANRRNDNSFRGKKKRVVFWRSETKNGTVLIGKTRGRTGRGVGKTAFNG